jgi:aminomethyltransferase
VLDDLFTYRLAEDRYLTVTNAANHEKDSDWFFARTDPAEIDFDVDVAHVADQWAMLAVQGPQARAALASIASAELPARMRTAELALAGVPALVCGTGYTGEDGCELLLPPDGAAAVWDALLERGVTPAGLGARDTLRLEVCFHLYGNDLSEDRNPIEAGLGWCCKLDTGFIGAEALAAVTPTEALVPFAFTGPGIPRQDNPIAAPHGAGVVTSGSLSPCLEIGIGMGYVPIEDAAVGTPIEVDVRGKVRAAEVRDKPLYRKADSG